MSSVPVSCTGVVVSDVGVTVGGGDVATLDGVGEGDEDREGDGVGDVEGVREEASGKYVEAGRGRVGDIMLKSGMLVSIEKEDIGGVGIVAALVVKIGSSVELGNT